MKSSKTVVTAREMELLKEHGEEDSETYNVLNVKAQVNL